MMGYHIKSARGQSSVRGQIKDIYNGLPLYFIQNNGELDKGVIFYERGGGHATFFTKEGVYLLLEKAKVEAEVEKGIAPTPPSPLEGEGEGGGTEVIKLAFIDANKDPEIIGEKLQEGKVNYFISNDPTKWKTNIPTYKAVVYKEIYPGIDIKFYGNSQQLEYDIIIKPGTDPAKVKLSYEGIKDLNITEEGDLEIDLTPPSPPLLRGDTRGVASSPAGEEGRKGEEKIIQKRPYIYQEIDGKRVEVDGRFKVQREDVILSKAKDLGFKDEILRLMPQNDKGSRDQGINDVGAALRGRPELKMQPQKTGQPHRVAPTRTPKSLNPAFIYGFDIASYDKRYPLIIDPVIVYSTYMGGSGGDQASGIAIDTAGNIYITGSTSSIDLPNASSKHRTLAGPRDAFVAKIDASGGSLIYLTYLGGGNYEKGIGIAVDSSGNAYVTGSTSSTDFPTKDPVQLAFGGHHDAFVVKLDHTGSALIYSTYLGGTELDEGTAIAVDSSGYAYVTGNTGSTNFPTKNPFQSVFGSEIIAPDAFVAKLNPSGSKLVYSTYMGGNRIDRGFGITVDSSDNAYVTGLTNSENFPIKNPLQARNNGVFDVFIVKFNSKGDLIYSTYLGGNRHDEGFGIAVDSSENIYVAGRTASTNFPTKRPLQQANGNLNDAFVSKLNPTGSELIYSTYLGGSNFDEGYSIAIDSSGSAYITGITFSTDFPTKNPLQPILGGISDAFVAKLDPAGSKLIYSTYLGGSDRDHGQAIAIDPSGNAYVAGRTSSTDFMTKEPMQATAGGNDDAFLVKIADAPQTGKR